jgi:hypothetical protein
MGSGRRNPGMRRKAVQFERDWWSVRGASRVSTNTKWSAVRGIFGSSQTKGYKPIAVVAPEHRRLRAGVIPRTRNISEYAIEWPARAESNEKLTSVVKPAPRGKGVGGRMPWRASTDFCTGCKREFRLAPKRAMPECKMAGELLAKVSLLNRRQG